MRSPVSHNQLIFDGFETDFEKWLDHDNRWVRLSRLIDWTVLSEAYNHTLSGRMGRPAKDARLVIGAVIIKHKLCLSDEETIEQIRENPYLQYFVGFKAFYRDQAFAPSLFVDIRRRMGPEVFSCFEQSIIEQLSKGKASPAVDCDDPPPSPPAPPAGSGEAADEVGDENDLPPAGKLILDATVAEQAIRYPTDPGLLNEAREISELIIDKLHPLLDPLPDPLLDLGASLKKKPRTYRRKARQDYLSLVKQRRPGARKHRQAIRRQLQYLKRNLGHIETLLDRLPGRAIPLSHTLLRQYWIIQHVYLQQKQMFDAGTRRCDDRIVSVHQPHVRPIVSVQSFGGKLNKSVEFGARPGVSLTGDGIACVDHISWDA
jgi:transposase, IS5 family